MLLGCFFPGGDKAHVDALAISYELSVVEIKSGSAVTLKVVFRETQKR